MSLKGVILAGGKGTRLGELTCVTNKHLLPVGPWPMVYHPLKKLVGAGITDILLVTGTEHMGDFVSLLGSGRAHGCSLTYRVQDEAGGIAQALGLAEKWCAGNSSVVLLGDNIFQDSLVDLQIRATGRTWSDTHMATVFLKRVPNPSRYGVPKIESGEIQRIEEKPATPPSDYAVTGLYLCPPDVFLVIKDLKPSGRGELEITDVNNHYIGEKRLKYRIMEGYWTDAGTPESLALANKLVTESPPRF